MTSDLATKAIISLACRNHSDEVKWFTLFHRDVEGAEASFELFERLRLPPNPANNGMMMYHASCFVCAVRRAGRLLKLPSERRTRFCEPVARAVKLEWKKRHAYFESFKRPRDAIEHIDEKARDHSKWAFFNFHGDRFDVDGVASVTINQGSLETLRSCRDSIARDIVQAYSDPILDLLHA